MFPVPIRGGHSVLRSDENVHPVRLPHGFMQRFHGRNFMLSITSPLHMSICYIAMFNRWFTTMAGGNHHPGAVGIVIRFRSRKQLSQRALSPHSAMRMAQEPNCPGPRTRYLHLQSVHSSRCSLLWRARVYRALQHRYIRTRCTLYLLFIVRFPAGET